MPGGWKAAVCWFAASRKKENWRLLHLLLRQRWPDLEYIPDGHWVRLPQYGPLPDGWSPSLIPVVFQIQLAHPGTPPYGFYVPVGIQFVAPPHREDLLISAGLAVESWLDAIPRPALRT